MKKWIKIGGLLHILILPLVVQAEELSQPRLQVLGRYAVTESKLPESSRIKIRVSRYADFFNGHIVITEMSDSSVKSRSPSSGSVIKSWRLYDVKDQPVLAYDIPNAMHIGIGVEGYSVSPNKNIAAADGYQTIVFSTHGSGTLILDIKFEPSEF